MLSVVLDTNIIFSALYSRNTNPPSVIVDMALRNKFSVYISSEILKEYDEVLHRKKYERKILKSEADELIRIIDAIAIHHNPKTSTVPPFADETDRKFYDLAKSANAYLVTGNIKHFPQEPKILSPADFLKIQ